MGQHPTEGTMTVKEFIALLKTLPQNAEVRVWDADADDYVPVTGALFEDGHTTVDLQTDDPS